MEIVHQCVRVIFKDIFFGLLILYTGCIFSILNALHCALFAFVEFVAGSDICKFGDWGVWGVCNSGSQQRIRKVSEMMMKMMKLVIKINHD